MKNWRVKHGQSGGTPNGKMTPTYMSWHNMKQRCRDPGDKSWARYGGRGITFCEEWIDFNNFFADMGERPMGKTLDRENNDGNYEPSNCRWATSKEQQAHRIKSHCQRGHPFDNTNTYVHNGGRQCKICRMAAMGRYNARKKANSL